MTTAEVCRRHGISQNTFYKWKAKFGGMDVSDARKLKTLESENARLNGLAPRLVFHCGEGFKAPVLRRAGPFDLILANILAQPLNRMAKDLARHLTRGGLAVLAGLLRDQEAVLRARYRAFGLLPEARLQDDHGVGSSVAASQFNTLPSADVHELQVLLE